MEQAVDLLVNRSLCCGRRNCLPASICSGYRSLEENQRVQFDITQGQKGPQAEHVTLI